MNCPKCGAPLPPYGNHTVAICVYCNSNVRLRPGPAGQPEATTLSAVEMPAGVMDRIKELVNSGQP